MKTGLKSFSLAGVVFLLFCSCHSTKVLSGQGNYTVSIMILNEKDKPICDYTLLLTDGSAFQSGITNQSGICVFQKLPPGELELTGTKNAFSRLKGTVQVQNSRNKLLCFKVYSAEYVLRQAMSLYENQKYEQGCAFLEELYIEENCSVSKILHLYKAYGAIKCGELKKAEEELFLSEKIHLTPVEPLHDEIELLLKEELK